MGSNPTVSAAKRRHRCERWRLFPFPGPIVRHPEANAPASVCTSPAVQGVVSAQGKDQRVAIALHDVAKAASVSFKTVSNVVNNHPHVRPETRAQVQAAIDELGYQPNVSARHLRSGRSGVISVAVPELSLAYFAQLADEVIQAAQKRGLIVLVEQTVGDRDRDSRCCEVLGCQLTDGLLFSPLGSASTTPHCVDIDTPLVLLGERIFHGPADGVTMRNVEVTQAATEHLFGLGRRRIAVLGAHDGEVVGSAGLRFTGCRQALEGAGIEFDESLVAHVGLWQRANGAEGIKKLLDADVQVEGGFAMNDELALGAMRMLQRAGLGDAVGRRGDRL